MPENGSVDFYKAFFEEFKLPFGNFNIKCTSDAPIQSGLGSSAAAAVALVAALARIKGVKMSRGQIAEKAWEVCNNRLGLYSGKQDEYRATFGGFGAISFFEKGLVEANNWSTELAQFWLDRIMLFYTGGNRKDPKIQEGFKNLAPLKEKALKLIKMNAKLAIAALAKQDIFTVAELLNESWEAKKKSNNVTTPHIDLIYDTALKSGALAGKLLGSGGGGFMAFLVEPENQLRVITELEKISGVKNWDYSIDNNGVSTRIL